MDARGRYTTAAEHERAALPPRSRWQQQLGLPQNDMVAAKLFEAAEEHLQVSCKEASMVAHVAQWLLPC